MLNKEFNPEMRVVVFTREEVDKKEFDWDKDLEDEICNRLDVRKFREVMSDWDVSGKYYVCIVWLK